MKTHLELILLSLIHILAKPASNHLTVDNDMEEPVSHYKEQPVPVL